MFSLVISPLLPKMFLGQIMYVLSKHVFKIKKYMAKFPIIQGSSLTVIMNRTVGAGWLEWDSQHHSLAVILSRIG